MDWLSQLVAEPFSRGVDLGDVVVEGGPHGDGGMSLLSWSNSVRRGR
jgi:hypothetical protein